MASNPLCRVVPHVRRAVLGPDGAGLSDAELLNGFVARRDEDAFAVLVRRHGPMVLGVCRRVLGNTADAEDAFQATFLVLVKKAASLQAPSQVGNWLYGVAVNTSRKAKAMTRNRRMKERQAAARPRRDKLDDPQPLQARLDDELSCLPDKYRVPIVLCDLEGKPLKEAARQLGWPLGTVASRLSRGRALLARRLKRVGLLVSGAALAGVLSERVAPAAPPGPLVSSTLKAAALFAAGPAAATLPAPVAALTEGVLKAMLLSKLKVVAGLSLLVVAVAAVAGAAGVTSPARPSEAKADAPPPARLLALAPDSPRDDGDGRTVADPLDGEWRLVSVEYGGVRAKFAPWVLAFRGDRYTSNCQGSIQSGTYRSVSGKPGSLDLLDGNDPNKGATQQYLFRLEGDTLTLGFLNGGRERPASFDAPKVLVATFKRGKQ
jgi:RNA polymerase sigma-70 factor (ECF subfamily)